MIRRLVCNFASRATRQIGRVFCFLEAKMFKSIATILVLASLLLPFTVSAEEEEEQKVDYQLTVTGDRLEEPSSEKTDSIVVITEEQIRENQWNYVIDAIRTVPGINVVQSGSPGKTTSVFLRGAGSAQVLVLIDGA